MTSQNEVYTNIAFVSRHCFGTIILVSILGDLFDIGFGFHLIIKNGIPRRSLSIVKGRRVSRAVSYVGH